VHLALPGTLDGREDHIFACPRLGWIDGSVCHGEHGLAGLRLTPDAAAATAALPAPSVGPVMPWSAPLHGGRRVTVTGSGFRHHVERVVFGATPGRDVRVISASRLQVTAPAHAAGLVHVRVRTSAGWSPPNAPNNWFKYVGPPKITGLDATRGPSTGGAHILIYGTNITQ